MRFPLIFVYSQEIKFYTALVFILAPFPSIFSSYTMESYVQLHIWKQFSITEQEFPMQCSRIQQQEENIKVIRFYYL